MAKKNDQQHEAVMKCLENFGLNLEKMDSKVDQLRTEDVPGINTRISLLEEKLVNLKDDIRKESKRDAKIYGGIGSATATLIAIALSVFRR